MASSKPKSASANKRLRSRILRWYDANRRDLPWRRVSDPYAIWISEAMLQQTRVETVIPYWNRFLAQFPDVATLARAELDDVYAVWTGLGYYSRARNLKHAAETIVAEYAGNMPNTAEELKKLKGIGPYTAGAVASIAFQQEAPLVDGNVMRVFSRLFGIREDIASKSVVDRMWSIASELVRGERPGDFNQGLMELGATVCTPRAPLCLACPVRRGCDAHARGDAESLPVKKKKTKQTRMRAVAVYLERNGKVLFVRRPETGLMAGLWELPGGEIGIDEEAKDRVASVFQQATGLEVRNLEAVGAVEHLFTHRRLELEIFRAEAAPGGRVRRQFYTAHRWLAPKHLLDLAPAGPTRKALTRLGVTDEMSARAAAKQSD